MKNIKYKILYNKLRLQLIEYNTFKDRLLEDTLKENAGLKKQLKSLKQNGSINRT